MANLNSGAGNARRRQSRKKAGGGSDVLKLKRMQAFGIKLRGIGASKNLTLSAIVTRISDLRSAYALPALDDEEEHDAVDYNDAWVGSVERGTRTHLSDKEIWQLFEAYECTPLQRIELLATIGHYGLGFAPDNVCSPQVWFDRFMVDFRNLFVQAANETPGAPEALERDDALGNSLGNMLLKTVFDALMERKYRATGEILLTPPPSMPDRVRKRRSK